METFRQFAYQFRLPASHIPAAFLAVKGHRNMGSTTNLRDRLEENGWETEVDAEGNITGIFYVGAQGVDGFKILSVLAPFVLPGSRIEMISSKGGRIVYRFDGEKMTAHKERAASAPPEWMLDLHYQLAGLFTEGFPDDLALDMAYLWPASATQEKIEVLVDSSLVVALRDLKVPADHPVRSLLSVIPG